ncbi:hypothetical protein Tco_1483652 [Tanacetum coccineum]
MLLLIVVPLEGNPEEELKDHAIIDSGCSGTTFKGRIACKVWTLKEDLMLFLRGGTSLDPPWSGLRLHLSGDKFLRLVTNGGLVMSKVIVSIFSYEGIASWSHRVPLDEIQMDDKLHFVKEPIEIMDREGKRLKQCRIPIVRVRWNSRRGPEFTWEREDQFRSKYPHLFTNTTLVDNAT